MTFKYCFDNPLISLHIPKCAGTSFINALVSGCKETHNLIFFYPDEGMLLPDNLKKPNTIIHGHFIRSRGMSVETVCPGETQYITILREPFDLCVSLYYYGIREGLEWANGKTLESFLNYWLSEGTFPLLGGLPELTPTESIENYCKRFLCIGTTENISDYYTSLERVIGLKLPSDIKVNVSPRDTQNVLDVREEFKKRHARDYELFEYVLARKVVTVHD